MRLQGQARRRTAGALLLVALLFGFAFACWAGLFLLMRVVMEAR